MNTGDTIKDAVLFLLEEYQEKLWALHDEQRGINQDYASHVDCEKKTQSIRYLIKELS